MESPHSLTVRRSAQHRRTRRDHASETAEDYVEAVADILQHQPQCRGCDLADRFGVSHVTVSRTVGRLRDEGLLETAPYSPITLTAKGRRLAAKCRERHQTVFRFLLAIGIDEETAALDAEGIEHHVSPQTLKCFRDLVAQEVVGSARRKLRELENEG